MKRILFVMILGACMSTGCTHTGNADAITHNVPVEKYMDLKQLEQLCKSDTLHNKALIFVALIAVGAVMNSKNISSLPGKRWIPPFGDSII